MPNGTNHRHINEFLSKNYREPCPDWLNRVQRGCDHIDLKDFFDSRIVYYPGSGCDGHAVRLFGGSHSAHCFVYADYSMSKDQIIRALDTEGSGYWGGFKGYHSLARISLTIDQIFPPDSRARSLYRLTTSKNLYSSYSCNSIEFYGLLQILQRIDDLGDDHGPHRLAILFLGADAHAAYGALFCNGSRNELFAAIIQDHGFAGNHSVFGEGGIMHKIAKCSNRFPELLLVAEQERGTTLWDGYSEIPKLQPSYGGIHNNMRSLYKRRSDYPRSRRTPDSKEIDLLRELNRHFGGLHSLLLSELLKQ